MCTSNFNGTISSNDPLFGLRGLVGFVIRIPWSLCSDTSRYACLTPSKECVLNAVMSVACGWMSWIALLPFRDVYIVSILLSSSLNKAYYLLLFILIDMCFIDKKSPEEWFAFPSQSLVYLLFPLVPLSIPISWFTPTPPSNVQSFKCTKVHIYTSQVRIKSD